MCSADTRAILAMHKKGAASSKNSSAEDGDDGPSSVVGNPMGPRVIGKVSRKAQGLERPRKDFAPSGARAARGSDV